MNWHFGRSPCPFWSEEITLAQFKSSSSFLIENHSINGQDFYSEKTWQSPSRGPATNLLKEKRSKA